MDAHTAGRLARCLAVGLAALCFAAFAGACASEKEDGQAELPRADGEFRVYEEWPFGAEEARRRQEETARALGVPVEKAVDLGRGVRMELVLVPAGEFMMGSPANEAGRDSDEGPQHRVRIAQPFYMGKYEVTQREWRRMMGRNPSFFSIQSLFEVNERRPVDRVSWHECQEFVKRLCAKERVPEGTFRLPTEAEWEYACRAGAATAFSFGDDSARLGVYAWHRGNSGRATHPVGEKEPNAWGLHDMHGNVWEWCQSLHKPYPYRTDDGRESLGGGGRVLRGCSWFFVLPDFFRCAYRYYFVPERRCGFRGFRVARTLTP